MPLLSCAVTELTDHIFMPIIRQLSHRLLERLSLDKLIGDRIYIDTEWATHSRTSTLENDAIVENNAFRVEANLQMNPTSQKWEFYTFHHTTAYGISPRTLHDSQPVFCDTVNRIKVIQMISPVTIVMNCKLQLMSADLSFSAPQQIFNAWENGAVFDFNDLMYDYPIPRPILETLYGLWKLDRQYGEPGGISFAKYLAYYSNNTIQVHTNRDIPGEYEAVIPMNDLKTLATLEYSEDRPNGEMEGRLPTSWEIPFMYTVQFGMPTLNLLQFPILVDNQLVPAKYIPHYAKNERINRTPEFHHGYADQKYDRRENHHFISSAKIPFYDDWKCPSNSAAVKNSHVEFAVMALQIDENEGLNTVIDFDADIDATYKLPPVVKEIMYQQGKYTTQPDSIITISLFREDKALIGGRDYTFDRDMKLRFKAMNTHSHYHAVLSIAGDIYNVNPDLWWMFAKYFNFLNDSIRSQVMQFINNGWWLGENGARLMLRADGNLYTANPFHPNNFDQLYASFVTSGFPCMRNRNHNEARAHYRGCGNLLNDSTGAQSGEGAGAYADYQHARIFRTVIIARKSGDSET